MPHKVNPIDFENAEGNFGISSALLDFFANKLTKSRHQRDLSDSTVLRNIGLGFGYSALAIKSANNGLNKITPNKMILKKELNDNWEVLTEAIQTLMRYEGIPDAYEQLKNLSRGSKFDQESYINFINSLGETPIIVFLAVSNDIVITEKILALSAADNAASTSSNEESVSIHKKSTPPSFRLIACL